MGPINFRLHQQKFSFKFGEVIIPFYFVLVKFHLKYYVRFWTHLKKESEKLDERQKKSTKLMTRLRNKVLGGELEREVYI